MLSTSNRSAAYIDPSSAQNYHNNNDLQYTHATRFINEHKAFIHGPVLDIGCGDGKATAYIAASLGCPVTGVDISAARVEFANQTYGNTQIQFSVANAITLDQYPGLPLQHFQTIVSFSALHHIPKKHQLAVFQHIRQHLQPDGVALLLIPGSNQEIQPHIVAAANNAQWKHYFDDFNLDAVRTYEDSKYYHQLAKLADYYLCDATITREPGGKELNREEMKNYLAGWLPQLAHLKSKNVSAAIQDAFLFDIIERYFQASHKQAGEKLNPVVKQNKLLLFASEASFFKHVDKNDTIKSMQLDLARHFM